MLACGMQTKQFLTLVANDIISDLFKISWKLIMLHVLA